MLDHLGSVAVVLDQAGAVAERLSYDAWGKQRNASGTDAACGAISSATTRGFTNQEQMPGGCLVNLNARLYDPDIGRFLAAAPTVEQPYNLQDLNRYSYVGNNPLSFTDPTGLCFLGCTWKDPIVRSVLSIATAIILQQPWAVPSALASVGVTSSTLTAGIAGGVAGYVGTGTLKGALIGAGEASAFAGIHFLKEDAGLTSGGVPTSAGAVFASAGMHGFVGGLASVAGGGTFQSGFLSAGFSDLAGPAIDSDHLTIGSVTGHAVVGGVGSVLGGGKFANGAVTGAFGYLFNESLQGRNGNAGVCAPWSACDEVRRFIGDILNDPLKYLGDAFAPFGGEGRMFSAFSRVSAAAEASKETATVIEISASRFGQAAEHIADAQAAGKPSILTIDRLGAEANRAAATRGFPKVSGMQLDEYPPAMFSEGGAGASVRAINPSANMSAGSYIGNCCRALPNGSQVQIKVVP